MATTVNASVTPAVTMKELLEAGVHFGHQTKRWNPKMKEYIFGERNGIYIIDLQKTYRLLQEALQHVQELAAQGRVILFVGTKRQAQEAVAEEAQRCGTASPARSARSTSSCAGGSRRRASSPGTPGSRSGRSTARRARAVASSSASVDAMRLPSEGSPPSTSRDSLAASRSMK